MECVSVITSWGFNEAMQSTTTEATGVRERPEWTVQTGVPFINGVLDLILKLSVLLLVLPALAILTYLRIIHRTDLFLPAVTSGPGLFALLEATFILCACILCSFVGPSWIASQIAQTYSKTERPTLGAASYVIFSGVVSGLCLLTLFPLLDAAWPAWLKWLAGVSLGLAIPVTMFLLAWYSPPGFRTLTDTERADRKKRTWQSAKRTFWVCLSAVIAVSTLATFAQLFPLYGLNDDSWLTWVVGTVVFPAALFPGAMYLARRSWGDSKAKAVTASAVMLALTVFVLLLNGLSLEPLALLTMRAMSVTEKEPRTFELVAKTERPAYQKLGFQFIGDTDFFKASIRFQFGDVRLLCVDTYDVFSPHPNAIGQFGKAGPGYSQIPRTGCVTLGKDEVRVVDVPLGVPVISVDNEHAHAMGLEHDGPSSAGRGPSPSSGPMTMKAIADEPNPKAGEKAVSAAVTRP